MTYKTIAVETIPDTGLVIRGDYNFFRYQVGPDNEKLLVKIVDPSSNGGEVVLSPGQAIQVPHWREIHVKPLQRAYKQCWGITEECNSEEESQGSDCSTYDESVCNVLTGVGSGIDIQCNAAGNPHSGNDSESAGLCCDGYDKQYCPATLGAQAFSNARNTGINVSAAYLFLLSDCDISSDRYQSVTADGGAPVPVDGIQPVENGGASDTEIFLLYANGTGETINENIDMRSIPADRIYVSNDNDAAAQDVLVRFRTAANDATLITKHVHPGESLEYTWDGNIQALTTSAVANAATVVISYRKRLA